MKPLIRVEELAGRLSDPRIKLFRVELKPVGSDQNSAEPMKLIPGSGVIDLDSWSDPNSKLPHTMISPEVFQDLARGLGIDPEDELVLYDEAGVYGSPRVRYMFLSMGHRQVRVLDGGLSSWIESGGAITSEIRVPHRAGDFVSNPVAGAFWNQEQVRSAIADHQIQLFDARSSDRFHGRVEEPRSGLRRGHLPTAHSVPFSLCLVDGRMKSPEELKAIFSGFPEKHPWVFYCGSGVTACIAALAAEVAGYRNLGIYDGSWSEWGQIP